MGARCGNKGVDVGVRMGMREWDNEGVGIGMVE